MTFLIILISAAIGVCLLMVALKLARTDGALDEKLRRQMLEAEIRRKRAEVMAQQRSSKDAIDRLERGNF